MTALSDYLDVARRTSPEAIAVATGVDRYTYAEIDLAARRVAALLPSGPHRIGIALSNGPAWAAVLIAVWRSGGEAELFPARLPPGSLTEASNRENLAALIVDAQRGDEIARSWAGPVIAVEGLNFRLVDSEVAPARIRHRGVDGPGVVLFTSGTTGTPKAVHLSLEPLVASVQATIEHLTQERPDGRETPDGSAGSGGRKSSAYLIAFPLYHVSGLFLLMLALARKSPAVILERFAVGTFLDALEEWPIRQMVLNPTMLTELVECRDPRADDLVGRLVLVRSGSAPLSAGLREDFCRRFRVPVLQGYGSTETAGEVAGWTAQDFGLYGESKADSVGRSKPGVAIEIRDETDRAVSPGEVGRVAVLVPWFFDEFRDTGDLGYLDDDGFLFLLGRADDLINCGGFKIHPGAVEEALLRCPEVAECAVVAEPDTRLGQVPVAYVIPKESNVSEELIVASARAVLLPYQCPRRVYLVDSLPRNDMGKLLRKALRGDLSDSGMVSTGKRRP